VPKVEKMKENLLIIIITQIGTPDTLGALGTLGTYLSKYDKQKASCLHK
jgi:hypothetical protein